MKIILSSITHDDRTEVMEIFNYYVENSFAAYPDRRIPNEFFDKLLQMSRGYPTVTSKTDEGIVVGFGLLRPYNPMPAFFRTAEITYFLKPGYTGRGIGKLLLEYLLEKGKQQGINVVLANISSLNEDSIRFHLKNGFSECGHFREVGQKNGRTFDVLYFQKLL